MKWILKEDKIIKKWLKSHEKDGNYDRREIIKLLPHRNWNQIRHRISTWGLQTPPEPRVKALTIDEKIKIQKTKTTDKIKDSEYKKLLDKRTLYEIVGDNILSAVNNLPAIDVPAINIHKKKQEKEEMCLMLSDSHIGLSVDAKESGGLGSYNTEIFKNRLEYLRISLEKIFNIHFYNTPYETINVFLLGDMVEGMVLRASQMRLTDIKFVEQILEATDQFTKLFAWLAKIFPEINVYGVVGNHTRLSKEIGQYSPTDNFDYLIYKIIEQRLSNFSNIKFNISESWWMGVERMNTKFYVEHGDDFHSWLGIPFYGIKRGRANVRELLRQYLDEKGCPTDFDYFVLGHIHTPSSFNGILTNGSFCGASEFSLKKLKLGDPASQTIFSIHPRYGITWMRTLLLDNPTKKQTVKFYN